MKKITDPIAVASFVATLAVDHLFSTTLFLSEMAPALNFGTVVSRGGLNGDLESVYCEVSMTHHALRGMYVIQYVPYTRLFHLHHTQKGTQIFNSSLDLKAHIRETLTAIDRHTIRPL